MQRTRIKHFSSLIKHTVSVLSEWNISFDFKIGFIFFFPNNMSWRYQDTLIEFSVLNSLFFF